MLFIFDIYSIASLIIYLLFIYKLRDPNCDCSDSWMKKFILICTYIFLATNIIFAAILIVSNIYFNKNFLKLFLQTAFQLNDEGWKKLNFRWAYFFIFLAILNEIVWRTQPEATWVNFKVWGMLPITIIFTVMQMPLINKYKL